VKFYLSSSSNSLGLAGRCPAHDPNQTSLLIPDLGPDTYARWRASELGALTELLECKVVLDLTGDVGDRTVLNPGCGDGDLAIALWRIGHTPLGSTPRGKYDHCG
jgi:hypothetical protein